MPLFALPSMPNTYNLLLLLLITEEEDVVEEEHGILKKLFYVMLNFYVCFWINFAVLTCTARTPPVVEQWGDEYPLFR